MPGQAHRDGQQHDPDERRVDEDRRRRADAEFLERATPPLRERLTWPLMPTLYRSGRSSDALLAYEDTRRRIAGAMGADPGPALRSLHQRVLRQDPALLPGAVLAA
ncbi:AfsR/SARP family transcriptional regulator [Streptomyces sp. NPDC055287]